MALKIANTAVVDDSGNFVGEFGGLVVNNRLVFCEGRIFQGSLSGYATYSSCIEKFPFSSDTNATEVGCLSTPRSGVAGQSSGESGYSSAGQGGYFSYSNVIDKFPFAADGTATDVGDAVQARALGAGQSSRINGFGYMTGGRCFNPPTVVQNTIDKFPFSSDTNASDVGELTSSRCLISGQSSETDGYASGGRTVPPSVTTIDKFPFTSDVSGTNVADLTVGRMGAAGHSSSQSGYAAGGQIGGTFTFYNVIDKFPFAADSPATDVGDMTQTRSQASGQSSTVSGYSSGGFIQIAPGPGSGSFSCNTVDKFPFSADANATDVGELTTINAGTTGQQV